MADDHCFDTRSVFERFRKCRPASLFENVDSGTWLDWAWQEREAARVSNGCTPYAQSLLEEYEVGHPLAVLFCSERNRAHFGLGEPDLFSNDESILSTIERASSGSVPIYFSASRLGQNPLRVNSSLLRALGDSDQQIIVLTSYSHPSECTREAIEACYRLADVGVILSNRHHLIRGVNDDIDTLLSLNHRLLLMKVRPYEVHCGYDSRIPEGWRVDEVAAKALIHGLRGWTSGTAVPHLIMHSKDGSLRVGGPDYLIEHRDGVYRFRNYQGREYVYQES